MRTPVIAICPNGSYEGVSERTSGPGNVETMPLVRYLVRATETVLVQNLSGYPTNQDSGHYPRAYCK